MTPIGPILSYQKPSIFSGYIPHLLLVVNVGLTLFYFSWWFNIDQIGNITLYTLLFIGETYHVLMVLLFWFNVRKLPVQHIQKAEVMPSFIPSIDVFVTVAGEPLEVVKNTIQHIQDTVYPNKKIYILNDSYVAQKDNWREYEQLAEEMGISYFTRQKGGGAKAGNINHALYKTNGDLVTIFDADMAPHPDFFQKTVQYFMDSKMGFVQSPQYYQNHNENSVTAAAWQQQEFFFGPVLKGKQASNAAFICGTNVVIRRQALEQAGGMNETSIAEDFITSLYIHKLGWKSHYITDVLAEGLAPEDLQSYYKQQLRWARGSVEILFKHNPLFTKGLTRSQRLEYLASTLFYCNGVIVLIDITIPLIFLAFGLSPIDTTTSLFAVYFVPFMLSVVYSLHAISGSALTFQAISFTQSSWFLQIQAIISCLTGQNMKFSVTPKKMQSGNFIHLAYPHLAYVVLAVVCMGIGINREGLSPSIVTNISWVIFNILLFMPFIQAAIPSTKNVKNYALPIN